MKYLPVRRAKDLSNIRSLAANPELASYPALSGSLEGIIRSYWTYRRARGDAKKPELATPLFLPIPLREQLMKHFTNPPRSIEPFITSWRKETSPDVCLMCGCPKSGQLDHILPKSAFPEFSVFSQNLVPACDCNGKRGTVFVGPGNQERVLHPFFDRILKQRLVRAQIDPDPIHGYERPSISLSNLLLPAHQSYDAVRFHITNVLQRTDVLHHFDSTWRKLWDRPEDYFDHPSDVVAFKEAVRNTLAKSDRHYGTPNNWYSMIYAGIEGDPNASYALWQRMIAIR